VSSLFFRHHHKQDVDFRNHDDAWYTHGVGPLSSCLENNDGFCSVRQTQADLVFPPCPRG
jgi:hypothetical protein